MLAFVVSSASAFQAPAVVGRAARAAVTMNIADLPGAAQETGGKVWDPLGLSDMCPYGSTQQEWMRTAEVRRRAPQNCAQTPPAAAAAAAAAARTLTAAAACARRSSTAGSA